VHCFEDFPIAAFSRSRDSGKISLPVGIAGTDHIDVLRDEIQCDTLWLYLSQLVDEMGIQIRPLGPTPMNKFPGKFFSKLNNLRQRRRLIPKILNNEYGCI
jgi:hypothetical protein